MGPQGMLKIEKYKTLTQKDSNPTPRFEIVLRALYGKFRTVVARHLARGESYHVLTPSMRMQVRGTEFIFEIANDTSQVHSQTNVLGVRGAVTVDIAKVTENGLVYHQPVVLGPGYSLTSNAEYGVTEKTSVAKLTVPELRSAVTNTSPQVLAYASALAGLPHTTQLLGTGYALYNDTRPHGSTRIIPTSAPSSFDYEHPPTNRIIASPSENFIMPRQFSAEPFAVGHVPNLSRFLGPQPVDRVPLRGTVAE